MAAIQRPRRGEGDGVLDPRLSSFIDGLYRGRAWRGMHWLWSRCTSVWFGMGASYRFGLRCLSCLRFLSCLPPAVDVTAQPWLAPTVDRLGSVGVGAWLWVWVLGFRCVSLAPYAWLCIAWLCIAWLYIAWLRMLDCVYACSRCSFYTPHPRPRLRPRSSCQVGSVQLQYIAVQHSTYACTG